MIIIGNGLMIGLFSVLASVTWPRYFGRKNLGAITGQFTVMMVFASALGPFLFSTSLSYLASYQFAGWLVLVIYLILTICTLRANNPQLITNKITE